MDGTLVDTEPYWIAAEAEMVGRYGGEWRHEYALEMVGLGLWHSAEILQSHGVELDADTIVHELTESVRAQITANGVPWQPGARELLKSIRDAGIKTALVTMSIRSMAEDIVNHIGFTGFDVLVTGDQVTEAKPHPEPYQTALTLLDEDPHFALAIEDSLAGLSSARASGAVALGVPHMIPLEGGDAHSLWPTLAGRSVTDLHDLQRQHREASE